MTRLEITLGIVAYLAVTFLFIFNTVRCRGRFAINLDAFEHGITCPKCGMVHRQAFRKPRNLRQALWGGKTCEKCSCEFDKWGREVH